MKRFPILIALCALATTGLASCNKNQSVPKYTVSFKNYDGSLLSESVVKKGKTAVYNGDTPTRADTQEFQYTFKGWDQSLENITSNCTRVAQYNETLRPVTNYFTVTFVNYDGTLLTTVIVEEGKTAIYDGVNPTRANTSEYEYEFLGWDKPLTNITTDCTRIATYKETVIPVKVYYTVSFKNYDGTLLYEERVEEGHDATYVGEEPTRPNTSTCEYEFKGWDQELENITSDLTVIAQFEETIIPVKVYYVVSFKNYDGALLYDARVEEGKDATYVGETPVRPETIEASYTFKGWDKPLTNITSDCTRIAQYTETKKPVVTTFTVSFKNYDGTLLTTAIVENGGTASYTGETPVRHEDDAYTYTFSGWDKPLTNITTDCDRVAQFTENKKPVITYRIVSFKNYDGTLLYEDRVVHGQTASYAGVEPYRPETKEYTYEFTGWDKPLTNITTDCTRIAQFSETKKQITPIYTVTFKNYDGSVLQEALVEEGETVAYTGPSPVRAATSEFSFEFKGWDKSLENITGDCTRIAQYSETYLVYTVTFYSYDDQILDRDTVHYKEPAFYNGPIPTKPSTDTRYYTFKGWDKDISCITKSMDVKPIFDEHGDEKHITINYNNGQSDSEIEVTYGENYSLGTPSFPGFNFLGWYSNDTLIPSTGIWEYSGVSTLKAKWESDYFEFIDNGDNTFTINLTESGKAASEIIIPARYEGVTITAMGADFLRENTKIEKVTIPGTIKNIPSYSFYNCTNLKEATINEGVVTIGTYAFYSCALKEIFVPSTCTSIGNFAFEYCSNLFQAYIPKNVTSMGNYVFYGVEANAYICIGHESIPSSWDSSWSSKTNYINCQKLVNGDEFYYAVRSNYGDLSVVITRLTEATSQLQNYTIPSEIEGISDIRIGRYVFKDNKYIRSVDLTGVTHIYYQAFNAAINLQTVTFSEGLVSIEKFAFESCSSLTRVVIPNTCTEVLAFAFEYCSSLEYIYIPSTTVTIGEYAFYGTGSGNIYTTAHSASSSWGDSWKGSRTIYYDYVSDDEIDDFNYVVQSDLGDAYVTITGFKSSAKLKKNITIPDEIEGISDIRLKSSLFNNFTNLESVNLGEGVKSVPSSCFRDCTKLETVVLGSKVTSIGSNAFYNCSKLSSINMPNTLTTINDYAFDYCSSLGEIIIPISVSTIGTYAFGYTGRLVFLIEASVDQPNWDKTSSPWYGNSTSKSFIYDYVSSGVISDFKYVVSSNGVTDTVYITGLAEGSTNVNLVVPDIIDGITNIKIASYSFYGNTLLKSIDLGNSVTAVNGYAFYGNTSLRSVIIPITCSVIKNYAFQNCSTQCVLNCVVDSKPDGWDANWNYSECQVVWSYTR